MGKKALILTTSGGSGLIQAAKAFEQKLLAEDPGYEVVQKEILLDWGYKSIGRFGINYYDKIQRVGPVFAKDMSIKFIFLADYFFWPKFFFSFLTFLLKNNVERIIDTQPVGVSALIKALRLYNWIRKKNLGLEKVIVDLPTKRSTHFFNNIRRLSRRDKKYLKIISLKPLLEDVGTEEEFWKKYAGVDMSKVSYADFFVRDAFREYEKKEIDDLPVEVTIHSDNQKETDFIASGLSFSGNEFRMGKDKFFFSFDKEAKVITVLLGSQPAVTSTKSYVKKIIHLLKEKNYQDKYYLFVMCADENSLYNDIFMMIRNEKNYPKNLAIIPMPFQNEDTIAALFFRSNVTITRSGGGTILELLCASRGKSLIHSESVKDPMKGIPSWEAGNALYLFHAKGGEIINPQTFSERFLEC